MLTGMVAIRRSAALAFGQPSLTGFACARRVGIGSIAGLAVAPCARLPEACIADRTKKLTTSVAALVDANPALTFQALSHSMESITGFTSLNFRNVYLRPNTERDKKTKLGRKMGAKF